MTDPTTTTNDVIMFSDSMIKKLQSIADKNVVAAMLLQPNNLVYDSMHHITVRDGDALVSYCPAGKEQQYNDDRTWVRTGRQTIRIGRMVRKVLKPSIAIADVTIEEFGKLLQTSYEGEKPYDFLLVSGKKITTYYNSDSYIDTEDCEGGEDCSLWQSCMRYDECARYFDIYANNPDRIKMLVQIRKSDKLLMSRAIVWKLDCGIHFLDRVYTCDQMYLKEMQAYAIEQGWWYKERMSNDSSAAKDADGKYISDTDLLTKFVVSNINTLFDYFPYMDTMKYGRLYEQTDGFVSRYPHAINGKCSNAYFDCTGGGKSDQEFVECYDGKLQQRGNCRMLTGGDHKGKWCGYHDCEILWDGKVVSSDECAMHSFLRKWHFKKELVEDCNHYWVFPDEIIKFHRRKYAKQSEEYSYAIHSAAHRVGKQEKPKKRVDCDRPMPF